MRFSVSTNDSTAEWVLESGYELRRAREIVTTEHEFVGDMRFRQAYRHWCEEAKRVESKVVSGPRAAELAAGLAESERVLRESLRSDPDSLYTEAQRRYRQQKRAEIATSEGSGENLESAQERLISAFDGQVSPATIKLEGDEILVLLELVDVWLRNRRERVEEDDAPTTVATNNEDDEDPVFDAAAEFLDGLKLLRAPLQMAAQRVREKRLEKVKARTRVRTRTKGLVR